MKILAYILVPVAIVAIAASITWVRNRQPTSLQSGVESFRREMDALSPEAAPMHRRRTDPQAQGPGAPLGPAQGTGPNAGRGPTPRPSVPPSRGGTRSGPPRRPPASDRP
jgi:hypothetical protein